jgi:hypothetical protein
MMHRSLTHWRGRRHLSLLFAIIGLSTGALASGTSWRDLKEIKFLNMQVGWAATGSDVFWTDDAGATWVKRTPSAASARVAMPVRELLDQQKT